MYAPKSRHGNIFNHNITRCLNECYHVRKCLVTELRDHEIKLTKCLENTFDKTIGVIKLSGNEFFETRDSLGSLVDNSQNQISVMFSKKCSDCVSNIVQSMVLVSE